jgi:hypothetical protein
VLCEAEFDSPQRSQKVNKWPGAARPILTASKKSRRWFTIELDGRKAPIAVVPRAEPLAREGTFYQVLANVYFRPIPDISQRSPIRLTFAVGGAVYGMLSAFSGPPCE